MGIFNKLFKSKKEDDKLVILAVLGEMVAESDGIMDENEKKWISEFISSQPKMNESRFNNIIQRARKEGAEILNKINKMDQDEKLEILNFMIGVALSDGYFHGSEAMAISIFSVSLGFDPLKVLQDIKEKYNSADLIIKSFL